MVDSEIRLYGLIDREYWSNMILVILLIIRSTILFPRSLDHLNQTIHIRRRSFRVLECCQIFWVLIEIITNTCVSSLRESNLLEVSNINIKETKLGPPLPHVVRPIQAHR